jgi:hypothetical protein
MSVEYLVLQAEAEQGALARVRAEKLHQFWETLQAALDELGQQAWDLYKPAQKLHQFLSSGLPCSGMKFSS